MAMQLTKEEIEGSFRQAMFNAIKKEIAAGFAREEQEKKMRQANEDYGDRKNRYQESKQRFEKATEHMQGGLTAMDSCHTIFFEIFNQSKFLAEKLQFELEEEIRHKWGGSIPKVGDLAKSIIETMIKKSAQEDPNVFLPGILHFVELRKDSTIDASPLRFSSGLKDNKVANDHFNDALKKWLDGQGYGENRNGQVVNKTTKAVLTPDAFAKLRDDPTNGLTAHLKKQWQVEDIVQERAPAPSPGA